MDRNFAAAARKKMLRRGRALLRLRHDGAPPKTGQPDYLAGLSDAERDELGEIHGALERIERGIYGRCETCFGDVESDRLEALLWTRECQTCACGVDAVDTSVPAVAAGAAVSVDSAVAP
jgi:hypothetical protein